MGHVGSHLLGVTLFRRAQHALMLLHQAGQAPAQLVHRICATLREACLSRCCTQLKIHHRAAMDTSQPSMVAARLRRLDKQCASGTTRHRSHAGSLP